MSFTRVRRLVLLGIVSVSAGCASTPGADVPTDAEMDDREARGGTVEPMRAFDTWVRLGATGPAPAPTRPTPAGG